LTTLTLENRTLTENLPARIVLLLDSEGLVVSAKHSLSHPEPRNVSDIRGTSVHDFLHSNCAGDCGFDEMWRKALSQLQQDDFVEWELPDQVLQKLLRFNLTRPPSDREGDGERRQIHQLLTIRDITQYREAHELLRQREEDLVALVRKQSIDLARAQSQPENKDKNLNESSKLLTEFEEEIRRLSHRVIQAQENERKRIAKDLHDGIAQSLVLLKYSIEASIEKLRSENEDADLAMLVSVADQIKGTVEEVRRISWNLTPAILEDWGLQAAVERLCEDIESHHPDLKIECSLCLDGLCLDQKETPHLVSVAIFRVVQESLNNATKHAGASLIKVTVEELNDGIRLVVSDNGSGFEPEDHSGRDSAGSGLGLRSMRERVEATGGKFEIISGQGDGTTVNATWSEPQLKLLLD
jgi:signal transduction histidine kinase